ncbi:hypothetical protein HPB48_000932 [Haemaphysalis longicornis]|uniref:Uncharacterized protein n=1 Tax=Haemaphysalis longicornis TaxID=44386 RepID=A0A9J6GH80_HAELO|nr:hypothetical protein HPB48_000932 [Haemaphysalis longicornis]
MPCRNTLSGFSGIESGDTDFTRLVEARKTETESHTQGRTFSLIVDEMIKEKLRKQAGDCFVGQADVSLEDGSSSGVVLANSLLCFVVS